MQNTRPKIFAKLWSNRPKGKRRASNRTGPQLAALRIKELNRLFTARYGETLPNDKAGRDAVTIVAQHLVQLSGHPHDKIVQWARDRAPWLTLADIQDIVHDVIDQPRRWRADTLAWRLGLTYADRQALKLTTIGAIDCDAKQREAKRRHAKKMRERARRAAKKPAACPP